LEKKVLNRLNPKNVIMEQALKQMQKMTAEDMFKMFSTKILPLLSMASNVVVEAKKLRVGNNEWYAVLFRDKT